MAGRRIKFRLVREDLDREGEEEVRSERCLRSEGRRTRREMSMKLKTFVYLRSYERGYFFKE